MEYIKYRSVVRLVARRCYLFAALICASFPALADLNRLPTVGDPVGFYAASTTGIYRGPFATFSLACNSTSPFESFPEGLPDGSGGTYSLRAATVDLVDPANKVCRWRQTHTNTTANTIIYDISAAMCNFNAAPATITRNFFVGKCSTNSETNLAGCSTIVPPSTQCESNCTYAYSNIPSGGCTRTAERQSDGYYHDYCDVQYNKVNINCTENPEPDVPGAPPGGDGGSGTDPGDGSGTDPGDGSGSGPGDGSGTGPGDGSGTDPGDGEDGEEEEEDKEEDCPAGSTEVRCSRLTAPGPGDGIIPRDTFSVSYTPDNVLGTNAACPADRVINIFGHQMHITNMTFICDVLRSYVRPIAIMLASFVAVFIVLGSGKSGD